MCFSSISRALSFLALFLFVAAAFPYTGSDDSSGASGSKESKNAASSQPAAAKNQQAAEQVYEPGDGVKPPKLVHYVEPEFSTSSEHAFVDGVVKISVVVLSNGVPTSLHVLQGLSREEDASAAAAVKQWRFDPGTKDGKPVSVKVTVEVNFHLL